MGPRLENLESYGTPFDWHFADGGKRKSFFVIAWRDSAPWEPFVVECVENSETEYYWRPGYEPQTFREWPSNWRWRLWCHTPTS